MQCCPNTAAAAPGPAEGYACPSRKPSDRADSGSDRRATRRYHHHRGGEYPKGRMPHVSADDAVEEHQEPGADEEQRACLMSLKNASTINHLRFTFTTGPAAWDALIVPSIRDRGPFRALIRRDQLELVAEWEDHDGQ